MYSTTISKTKSIKRFKLVVNQILFYAFRFRRTNMKMMVWHLFHITGKTFSGMFYFRDYKEIVFWSFIFKFPSCVCVSVRMSVCASVHAFFWNPFSWFFEHIYSLLASKSMHFSFYQKWIFFQKIFRLQFLLVILIYRLC